MTYYRSVDGDRLDVVCSRHYGAQSGVVEAVLAANPGLADYGPILPAGLTLALPELAPPLRAVAVVDVWD